MSTTEKREKKRKKLALRSSKTGHLQTDATIMPLDITCA
jgi:hypothetical protein